MSLIEHSITESGVATLWLNDPEHRNAMSEEMAGEFKSAIEILANTQNLRCVILTGKGSAFSAGGNLQMLKAKSQLDRNTNRQRMLDFYHAFLSILSLPVPVIAAINGHAIGAGLCLASACDFRVVAQGAKLGFTFTRLALHPGMGATYFLPRLVGQTYASDFLISGRLFTAQEAVQCGLTNQITTADQVVAQAEAIAQSICLTGPAATTGLLTTLRPAPEELETFLIREAEEQAEGYARDEFLEGVTATIERRPPKYRSL